MIRRRDARKTEVEEVKPRGFDDYDLRLGDMMRGERATLGKSLLDVERELRIRAAYIAAIENADPDVFDTPGFIPGYVRSYARYLNMDPDEAFRVFCTESGFSIAHGMSAEASSVRKQAGPVVRKTRGSVDPLFNTNTPYVPTSESLMSRIEPGAFGSAFVLVALIGAIGFGGWKVLNEVQRVQFAPVENTPDVLSDLDPLSGALGTGARAGALPGSEDFAATDERLDRLYRPEALDVPVLVARDAPISTLSPAEIGTLTEFVPLRGGDGITGDVAALSQENTAPQVVEATTAGVQMIAVRASWVRVRAADGSVIFETIMNAGDSYDVPLTQEAPTLRAGASGSIYFVMNGKHYGPAGDRGTVIKGLPLDGEMLKDAFQLADIDQDQDLQSYVAELQNAEAVQE
jgi:cytoskeletal protein RodZ